MQIDFHHTVTYVVARTAGFDHDSAEVLAYGAQYVDDATTAGIVQFDNKAMYSRTRSAHKLIDPANLDNCENLQVWLPFHFLPGNGGLPATNSPEGTFIEKIICRPNSYVAREMVEQCILGQGRAYGLHRLAVTMHVFADTWAHQGFAGVLNAVNEVRGVEGADGSGLFNSGILGSIETAAMEAVPPIGHGQASTLPDLPFLQWTYRNGTGQVVARDNTAYFMEAADEMCKAMQRYRKQDARAAVPGLDEETRGRIHELLVGIRTADAAERHGQWLQALADDKFKFGAVELSYDQDRWKNEALVGHEITIDGKLKREYRYHPEFLNSNWKLFHDAVQEHLLTVLHDILPNYGICSG